MTRSRRPAPSRTPLCAVLALAAAALLGCGGGGDSTSPSADKAAADWSHLLNANGVRWDAKLERQSGVGAACTDAAHNFEVVLKAGTNEQADMLLMPFVPNASLYPARGRPQKETLYEAGLRQGASSVSERVSARQSWGRLQMLNMDKRLNTSTPAQALQEFSRGTGRPAGSPRGGMCWTSPFGSLTAAWSSQRSKLRTCKATAASCAPTEGTAPVHADLKSMAAR